MPSREVRERYRKIPYEKWKCYKVPIVGGINNWYYIEAPTKTAARDFVEGEINPWVKVRGKIIELTDEEYPRYRFFGPKYRARKERRT